MSGWTGTVAISVVLAFASLAPAADGTVVEGDLGAKLDGIVQRTTGGGFWGVVLVAKGGVPILAKGYGNADYASRPNGPETLFEIASISKSFTAAAILRLTDQKMLRLDDLLGKVLKDVPEDKKGITIRQLLNHTAGISPGVGVPYSSPLDRKAYLRFLLGKPLASKPGEKFAYANAAYALLAAIVEEVSGQPFEAYSKKELFDRAGLKDTGFIRDRHLDRARVTARVADGQADGTAADWNWGWGYRGMGGVVTTALDMLAWDRALRTTKVLSAAAKKAYYTPAQSSYALGWKVETTGRGTTKVHHSGGVRGFAANYVRYLEDDVVIVILSNGKTNIHEITQRIEGVLFPRPSVTAVLVPGPHEMNEYKGVQVASKGITWRVTRDGGMVRLELLTPKKHCLADLRVPSGEARQVLGMMKGYLEGRRPGGARETEAGIYLNPYTLVDGRVALDEDLSISAMPRYSGRDADGKTITDPRITFIVIDRGRRLWPVMVKMSDAAARRLVEALAKAVR